MAIIGPKDKGTVVILPYTDGYMVVVRDRQDAEVAHQWFGPREPQAFTSAMDCQRRWMRKGYVDLTSESIASARPKE